MTDKAPVEVKNLDRYGSAVLVWSRAHDLLAANPPGSERTFFLSTAQQVGGPHTAAVGAIWFDGDLYFSSGPETRKSRNLAANPACTISVKLQGLDLVLEGEARLVTDKTTLEKIAQLYRDDGWPAEVKDDALTAPYMAPSAGPPPWYVYSFCFHTAYGVATAEPNGATRWRFDR